MGFMNPQRWHWAEKVQVEVVAVLAFTVMWFVGWPMVRPWDPQGSLAFAPTGDWGALAAFIMLVLVLAACCAVLTLTARPAGALLATLVGVAGLALRGEQMRTLLWRFETSTTTVFASLALEALIMGAVLIAVAIVIAIVRGVFRVIAPRWVWIEPPHQADENIVPERKDTPGRRSAHWIIGGPLWVGLRSLFRRLLPLLRPAHTKGTHLLACLLMELAVATILLVITFRSTDRGQVAFALIASFFGAALIAHQTFPVRASAACWLGPIIMAVIVFLIGAVAAGSPDPPIWYGALTAPENLPLRAALPVDWLALGGAGAVGGFWLSRRIHHARLHHGEAKTEGA